MAARLRRSRLRVQALTEYHAENTAIEAALEPSEGQDADASDDGGEDTRGQLIVSPEFTERAPRKSQSPKGARRPAGRDAIAYQRPHRRDRELGPIAASPRVRRSRPIPKKRSTRSSRCTSPSSSSTRRSRRSRAPSPCRRRRKNCCGPSMPSATARRSSRAGDRSADVIVDETGRGATSSSSPCGSPS